MLGFIKVLPFILMLGGAGYAAHMFIVQQLEGRIAQQEATIQQYSAQNTALQTAAQQNEATIRSIEARMQQQVQQMTTLTQSNAALQAEKDQYLSIFRRHDLARLALARPGLIEPRINNGTEEVFRQLEADSREIDALDGETGTRVPDSNPSNDSGTNATPQASTVEPTATVEPAAAPAPAEPIDINRVATVDIETNNEQDDFTNFVFDLNN